MPRTQVERAFGTSAQIAAFTPASGEFIYDSDRKTIVVGDGVTLGGFVVAAPHLGNTFSQSQIFAATENFFGSVADGAPVAKFLSTPGAGFSTLDFNANGTPDLNFLRKYNSTPFQIELAGSGGIDLVIDSNNNETGTSVRFLTNAIRGGVQTLLFTIQDNGGLVATGALNMGTNLINNVVNPVAAQDAATKSYVDAGVAGATPPFIDTTALVKGSADATKLMRFEVDGFTTATTRVLTPPNADITLAGINIAQTFAEDQTFGKRILLSDTTSATVGGIYFGGAIAIHNFGALNFFAGVSAGNLTLSGVRNAAVGVQALTSDTTGTDNTAVGWQALFSNTTGNFNSAFGGLALGSNEVGIENSAFGLRALLLNVDGNKNTAIGTDVLVENLGGDNNTAVGYGALGLNDAGNNNLALGFNTGNNLTTGSNNIVIGYDIDSPTATNSNTLTLGNLIFGTGIDGTGTTISSGNVGIAVITPTSGLHLGRSFAAPYRATAVTTTFLATDYTIDCTSGTFTVNLPTAVGITGRIYVAKNSGVGTITLDPAGAELIDGSATATIVAGSAFMVQSTGAGWIIL